MNKEEINALFKQVGLTLGSVESFTGGLFAREITSVPGASHFYKGGLLTFLPNILSEYEHIVLSHVRNEILYDIRSAMDIQRLLLKNITYVEFAPQKEKDEQNPNSCWSCAYA